MRLCSATVKAPMAQEPNGDTPVLNSAATPSLGDGRGEPRLLYYAHRPCVCCLHTQGEGMLGQHAHRPNPKPTTLRQGHERMEQKKTTREGLLSQAVAVAMMRHGLGDKQPLCGGGGHTFSRTQPGTLKLAPTTTTTWSRQRTRPQTMR